MKHARPDYNRIQDPVGLIPDDEPVFLIRGQDKVGAAVVRHWAALAKAEGASVHIVMAALDHADRMDAWADQKASKVPDLPESVIDQWRANAQTRPTVTISRPQDAPGLSGYGDWYLLRNKEQKACKYCGAILPYMTIDHGPHPTDTTHILLVMSFSQEMVIEEQGSWAGFPLELFEGMIPDDPLISKLGVVFNQHLITYPSQA